jgi:hypothetical protein
MDSCLLEACECLLMAAMRTPARPTTEIAQGKYCPNAHCNPEQSLTTTNDIVLLLHTFG